MCKKCLYCYEPLNDGEVDFHSRCAKKIFQTTVAPVLPYKREEVDELAKEVIRSQTTLTGVQPKLSLDFEKMSNAPQRLTIVGLWGRFILKPQTEQYSHLPELEDVVMHMAEVAKIKTVPHSLIRFSDGELAYITRRIDRTTKGKKLPMEDMCQLSERLTEDKYKGSHEKIAKLIAQYSSAPMLDLVNYWEQVVFAWITGNADMHLKNYSLYAPKDGKYILTPAYDLLSTAIVIPQDTEELALTLAGKKRKFSANHFKDAMMASGISDKVCDNLFKKFERCQASWEELIDRSFLPEEMMLQLKALVSDRLKKLADR